MSFYQEWNEITGIDLPINNFIGQKTEDIIRAFARIGEEIANKSREGGTYKDRTGNLRASIWYAVLQNGRTKRRNVLKGRGESVAKIKSEEMLLNLSKEYNDGIVLIVGAGMEYAVWVEKNNYKVLTDFVYSSTEFENELKDLLE